jgi:hypothetical protein
MEWISTSLIEPGDLEGTVSGRFGGSVMFVAYSKFTRRWLWIYPGGTEKIEEPPQLFLDPLWAAAHPRTSPVVQREKPTRLRKKKSEQLLMDL